MKKSIVVSFVGLILLMGAGCTIDQNISNSTSSTVAAALAARPGSRFVDYKFLSRALKEGDSIKEVPQSTRTYGMPDKSIDKQQIKKYFRLKYADFALFQAGGVKESRELIPLSLERSGILYAYDDKQWHIFFEVINKEETDRNTPLYMWSEGEKIHILIHDIVGANNREGTAKILTTNNVGRTWNIERCFYLNMSEFNKLQEKNKTNFLDTLTTYLKTKFPNSYLNEEYVLNQKTGNFEYQVSSNDEPNKPVDACKNILVP